MIMLFPMLLAADNEPLIDADIAECRSCRLGFEA